MNDVTDSRPPRDGGADHETNFLRNLRVWLRGMRWGRNGDQSVRDVLEELIEEREEADLPVDASERALLANILTLRGVTVHDVMVPRADIVAVEAKTSLADLMAIIAREEHSRMPVYRETLDDVIGMVHIKDVVSLWGDDKPFSLNRILRKVLFVAPSMRVLDLLLEMRSKRTHMALVVDEFGGIDGLVTIEDLVEEIVGEIEDEHDIEEEPELVRRPDGTVDAHARASLEDFEALAGPFFTDEEREHIDTLGGLVFSLAGRIPARGELLTHPSGLEFEVLDADPRRIKRLRVRHVAQPPADSDR